MAAEVIRQEQDSEHRYRITRTDKGHLVTMRSRKGLALWLPAEWLHRTCEAADACLDAVMVTNAVWLATQAGHSANDLLRTADARNATYAQVCDRLNDHPVMGQEVRALREAVNDGSQLPP